MTSRSWLAFASVIFGLIFLTACAIGSLSALGYMRPAWGDVAIFWGAGSLVLVACCVLAAVDM